MVALTISVMLILLPFLFIQKYSNSPGNIVWPILFFGYSYAPAYIAGMIIIGLITLLISLWSLVTNLYSCCYPLTTKYLSCQKWQFRICLFLMLVCEVIGVFFYLVNDESNNKENIIARTVLLIFIVVNMLDFLFWVYGYCGMDYEKGDNIR